MSSSIRRILSCVVPMFLSLTAATAMAQMQMQMTKPDTSCPRYKIAANLKQVVIAHKGEIEPIHIPDGIAVLATSNSAAGTKAIQAAAASYAVDMQKASPAGGSNCASVMQAVKMGEIKESVVATNKGVLITLITRNEKLRDVLQLGNCCDYCICPAGTHTQCASCC